MEMDIPEASSQAAVPKARFMLRTAPRLAKEERKALRKRIMQLAGPSLAEMLLINVFQMAIMMMVGRVGPEAVTAVGLTNQPMFFAFAIFMALNIGATAIIARAIGAGNREEADRAAQQTFLVNVVLSLVVTVLCYVYAKPILVLMGAREEVLVQGVAYAQVMFLSLGFTIVSMSLSAILRGAGDTKTPMKINIISGVLIAVIGFPLIYGFFGMPEMGVVGAAIATAISKLLSAVWMTYVLLSGKFVVRLTLRQFWRVDRELLGRIVHIGLPSAGEQFAMRFGQLIFTLVLSGLGTVAFAAHTICFNVLGLSFMPGMAFSLAASTLVGQGLGAKNPDMAEKYGWETGRVGRLYAGIIGVIMILFAPYIMMLYTNDPEVIRQGAIAMRIIGIVQLPQASGFILAGALRGAGDTKFPLLSTFVGVLILRGLLSLLFVLVFHWGIAGAYFAVVIDQCSRSMIIYFRYRSGRWKTVKV
jgi:putative MATE family efflux protein